MKRRAFIKYSALSATTLAAMPHIGLGRTREAKMARIGLTTVVFRNRFRSSQPKNQVLKDELTLLDIPEYFTDRFGIHNVEFWTPHFESTDKLYLRKLKKKLSKHKCQLIDLQAEGKFDPSDPLEENSLQAIAEAKQWIDIAVLLQSKSVRIKSMKKSYEKAVISLREITTYAQSKGVRVLVENHNDLFSNPQHHINIMRDIPQSNIGLLADFGNYRPDVDRYEALKKIAPHTRLISAKTQDFSNQMKHTSYDFGKCIRIFEEAGYKGIYACEQWGKANPAYDYEKITDWMIENIRENI